MNALQRLLAWWQRLVGRAPSSASARPIALGAGNGVPQWLPTLEWACLRGDLGAFDASPEDVCMELASRERSLLVGPQVFGRRILRSHPNVLLLFVERGWWSVDDLGRFVEQTCYFGSPYFMSGLGGVLGEVPIEQVREWSGIILAKFGLNAERRRLFVSHMVASMSEATWLCEGHLLCKNHVQGLEMDVLLAVARRTRPHWVALEMHWSLDLGLRSIVWPLIDLKRPTEAMFMPQSGVCPELDLLLGVERPFSCDALYDLGVRIKAVQRTPPETYPVPDGI